MKPPKYVPKIQKPQFWKCSLNVLSLEQCLYYYKMVTHKVCKTSVFLINLLHYYAPSTMYSVCTLNNLKLRIFQFYNVQYLLYVQLLWSITIVKRNILTLHRVWPTWVNKSIENVRKIRFNCFPHFPRGKLMAKFNKCRLLT